MTRLFAGATLLLSLAAPALAQSIDWELVGPPAFSASGVTSCRIAFDSQDVPHVAYQDLSPGARTSVQRFVGGSWQYVGAQGGASVGTAWYNQIAFDSADNMYVATRDYGFGGRINVRAFPAGGSAWSHVGVPGMSVGEAHYTAIALRQDGTPYIAYSDRTTSPPDRASAMIFTNGIWSYLGAQGLSSSAAGYTSIAVNGQGVPYVGFSDASFPDGTNAGKGTVMRFEDASQSWQIVGTAGFTLLGALNATVAIDRTGVPWFAYHQYHSRIIVSKFDGAEWVQVGVSASGADHPEVATEPWRQWLSLCFDSQNSPYVAYQLYDNGRKAAVRRFDGTDWVPVGSLGFTPSAADYLALAIDRKDVPYVAYRDMANTTGISVMRFAPSPSTYCTAKLNSFGCTAQIASIGTPSLSSTSACIVGASTVITHKTGMLLYSHGPAHSPFFGGFLCISGTILRTPPQDSGGPPGVYDCTGAYALDINPILQAPGSSFTTGEMLFAQYWYRDPQDPFAIGLSDAVRLTVGP